MIDIKEVAKNPGYALGAMLHGLQNPVETKDMKFQIDMDTFGEISSSKSICYGCAATCALQVVTGRSFAEQITPDFVRGESQLRAEIFGTNYDEILEFEVAIDSARKGYFHLIMDFFGYCECDAYDSNPRFMRMETRNWQKKIPAFEVVIERMHTDHPEWERFTQ